ncbi:phosphoribosyltransferase-like protein [Fennellomyces sp. T-0311]|nr:phosphoribosyltransferase-like protein [Fennellomyces sp. T-0311]
MSLLIPARKDQDPDLLLAYDLLTQIDGFPQPGVMFIDIFPIFRNPVALAKVIDHFVKHLENKAIDVIVGLEARGFCFGPLVALKLGIAFVPIRKKGKLPGECHRVSYQKEYGPDIFELQKEAIRPDARVVILDDVLATGGTAAAAEKLIQMTGATVVESIFLIQGKELDGAAELQAPAYSLFKI